MTSPDPTPEQDVGGRPGRSGTVDGDGDGSDPEGRMELMRDAAIQAEFETGHLEDTESEAKRGVVVRMATIVGGFLIVGVGIAAIPLPGPGWLIVFVGLTLLSREFDWAERWLETVRRRAKIDQLREKSIAVQIAVAVAGLVLMGAGIYWSLRRYL